MHANGLDIQNMETYLAIDEVSISFSRPILYLSPVKKRLRAKVSVGKWQLLVK
jgi:hypothetical protein